MTRNAGVGRGGTGTREEKERAGKTCRRAKKQALLQRGKYFLGISVVK